MLISCAISPRESFALICHSAMGAGVGLLAGFLGEQLGQPHGGVGLIIPELFILGDGKEGIGVDVERCRDGGAKYAFQLGNDCLHA